MACRKTSPRVELARDGGTVITAASNAAGAAIGNVASDSDTPVYDLGRDPSTCVAGVRGSFIDVGARATDAAVEPGRAKHNHEILEREGSGWLRVRDRSVQLSFIETEERTGDVVVSLRMRGGAARLVSVAINGRALGTAKVTRDEIAIAKVTGDVTLHKGANEISLRFAGGAGSGLAPFADIDWLHIGTPLPEGAEETLPFPVALVSPVAIGRESERSFSLASGAFMRCLVYLPENARVTFRAASLGHKGTLNVVAVRDRMDPETLNKSPIKTSTEKFSEVMLEANGVARPTILEFRATAPKGARVIVGAPRVLASRATPRPVGLAKPVRGVVLVIAGSLPMRSLASYGANNETAYDAWLPHARAFDSHRASSPFASANVASMLTGISALDLGMTDALAPLPRSVRTAGDVLRDASVATAMFTANPETFPAFGFGRGMERFGTVSPTDSNATAQLVDMVKAFVEEHRAGKFFVVLHTRGAHPPWDVKRERLRTLPPENYSGPLEPEQAGIVLARAARNQIRLTDADRQRASALVDVALTTEARALADLREALKVWGREADTLWMLTSDVGFDAGADVPYLASDTLDEPRLHTPLVLLPPPASAGESSRSRAVMPTDASDIAPAVLSAFGLKSPENMAGERIFESTITHERSRVAVSGKRISLRVGDFVLVKNADHDGRFCSLELEPACLADVRATHPVGYALVHRAMLERQRTAKPATKERAVLDPMTSSLLEAWGSTASTKQ